LVINAFVGESYEPLRRLLPSRDLFHGTVIGEVAWPEVPDEDDDETARAGGEPLELKTFADAESAAERLAPLILEPAGRFAERRAARQLRRWIDNAGDRFADPQLVAAVPVQSAEVRSFSEPWSRAGREAPS
jgi:hypothetical protein